MSDPHDNEDQQFELVMPFWIDTDGYTDRDREMFVSGVEFATIYQAASENRGWNQVIHSENSTRVRLMCAKLNIPVRLTRLCDQWTECEIPCNT